MPNENNVQISSYADYEDIYKIVYDYVESNTRSEKSRLSNKEKEALSHDEITNIEDKLKEHNEQAKRKRKDSQDKFESMCSKASYNGLPYLDSYIEAAKKLYEDKIEWKRSIKAMLVSPKSLKMFKDFRTNLVDLYPLLLKVNNTFPVDDYPELSLTPRAALYGSEVDKSQSGSTKRSPLSNEEIRSMLTAFSKVEDKKRIGEWLLAILFFDSSHIIGGFQKDYKDKRKELVEWATIQVQTNEKYRLAVTDSLIDGNKLTVLMNAYMSQSKAKSKQIELESKIKELEDQKTRESEEYQEAQNKLLTVINKNNAIISELQQKAIDFERCKKQLSEYINRYNIQIEINERIVIENDRRLFETETENRQLQEDLLKIKSQMEEIETKYYALESDFSLKSNELARLKDTATQKEENVKTEVKRDLISGIKEQLDYLTMFYNDLKETGKLEPENIELFSDTLENIDNALFRLGIKKIGKIEQQVEYDASIHTSADEKISNGDSVTIKGCGWKIGDEVYSKAQVEKGE